MCHKKLIHRNGLPVPTKNPKNWPKRGLVVLMKDLNDFKPISEAIADPNIPYTHQWISRLARSGRVEALKVAGRWLVSKAALYKYVEEMAQLGTNKHSN